MLTSLTALPPGQVNDLSALLKVLQLAADPKSIETALAELAKARAAAEEEQGRLKQFEVDAAIEREAANATLADLAEAQTLFDRRASEIAAEQERLAEERQTVEDERVRARAERDAGIQELIAKGDALNARSGALVDRERAVAIREAAVQAERAAVDRDAADLEQREADLQSRLAALRAITGA